VVGLDPADRGQQRPGQVAGGVRGVGRRHRGLVRAERRLGDVEAAQGADLEEVVALGAEPGALLGTDDDRPLDPLHEDHLGLAHRRARGGLGEDVGGGTGEQRRADHPSGDGRGERGGSTHRAGTATQGLRGGDHQAFLGRR
jgi:hypothetical protein